MPEFTARTTHEADIAEAASQVLDEQFTLLIVELGDEPPRQGVSDGWWLAFGAALTAALQPKLEAAYLDMALELALDTGIELTDAALMAADWSRGYTYDLVKGMTESRQALLQSAIGDYYDRGLSLDDLVKRLQPEFGIQRASSIGITETTRAASEAQKAYGDYLRGQGLAFVDVIETSNDERVCPICGPKHGKLARDEGYPPFHVRCRCWVNTIAATSYVAPE